MNRVVIITGGTSGIGKELAKQFFESGDKVYALGLNPDPLNEREFFCDVTDEKAVIDGFANIAKAEGKIDILITCAGFGVSGAAELAETKEIKRLFDVNYFGSLNAVKGALPHMKKGAKIVMIGSCCGIFAMPFRINYCASKSAVNMLASGLKMELKNAGIDVCVVNPGDVKTPFIQNRVKNFTTNERYGNRVSSAQEIVEKNNPKRMSVEYCAGKIFKIANKNKFKASYIVGFKYKVFNFLVKIFPHNLFIKVSNKIFGGKY
ncbi:MAG: SDR family NAD(P)-dependent oxidoreductase [Clostridia bacterium]|nr:SDR family NAD(P)-dependent oxidoreductase [Clostridia bacterium]